LLLAINNDVESCAIVSAVMNCGPLNDLDFFLLLVSHIIIYCCRLQDEWHTHSCVTVWK